MNAGYAEELVYDDIGSPAFGRPNSREKCSTSIIVWQSYSLQDRPEFAKSQPPQTICISLRAENRLASDKPIFYSTGTSDPTCDNRVLSVYPLELSHRNRNYFIISLSTSNNYRAPFRTISKWHGMHISAILWMISQYYEPK